MSKYLDRFHDGVVPVGYFQSLTKEQFLADFEAMEVEDVFAIWPGILQIGAIIGLNATHLPPWEFITAMGIVAGNLMFDQEMSIAMDPPRPDKDIATFEDRLALFVSAARKAYTSTAQMAREHNVYHGGTDAKLH